MHCLEQQARLAWQAVIAQVPGASVLAVRVIVRPGGNYRVRVKLGGTPEAVARLQAAATAWQIQQQEDS